MRGCEVDDEGRELGLAEPVRVDLHLKLTHPWSERLRQILYARGAGALKGRQDRRGQGRWLRADPATDRGSGPASGIRPPSKPQRFVDEWKSLLALFSAGLDDRMKAEAQEFS
jgi:hypothetical protein